MEKPKGFVKQNRNNIPASLAEEKRFFIKDSVNKNDNPQGWNEPENQMALDEVPENKHFGFVLSESQVLIDFDHAFDDSGRLFPEVERAYKRIHDCADTYTEISCSGKGLHLIIDLDDYADAFESITNDYEHIITPTMDIEAYKELSKEEKDKTPKIELFYRTAGRYVFLTGNNKKTIEVARNEEAAAIFTCCLKMVAECHAGSKTTKADKTNQNSADEHTVQQVKEWLNYINSDDREIWIRTGMACFNGGIPFEVWDEWSRKSSKYNDGKDEPTEKKWKGFSKSKSMWNIGTICTLAKEGGWHGQKEKKEEQQADNKQRFDVQLVSGRDLQKMDLPPIIYPIENMIPQGYTVGSAPFKYGKSWLALEMCLAIAQGADFLGQKTTKGASVYLALEDCDRFAKERLNMVLNGAEAPEGFYYIYENVPTLDDGFIAYLNQLYSMVPDIKLVVIDVLAIIEYQAKRGETAYKCDYRTGTALKQWADDHNTSVLAITHTTKMVHPNDIFMNTTGTSGVTGSADAILTIAKENRTDKDAVLAITGRRVREKYFKVHLKDGYIWETEGEVDPKTMKVDAEKQEKEARLYEYKTSEIRKAVLKIANAEDQKEMSSRDILDKARKHDIYLMCEPKELGSFITKYQNYFFNEDGIKVFIQKRGTASNIYKFVVWEKADEEVQNMFG